MLIEVVALQPPHHYERVVTIHLKKLLAGEPGEVNSVCSGGFTQEKTYYCAKCCKSFYGRCSMPRSGGYKVVAVKPLLHSITSSASASSLSGTVRPSILAVWALMTNSNLIDCTTGNSAGLAPLRMRPV
jgi:hypothetical protein